MLVGMTLHCNSESDKRPRKFGFTLMRNPSSFFGATSQNFIPVAAVSNVGSQEYLNSGYSVHETKPLGNDFRVQ